MTIRIGDHVVAAVRQGRAVLALESTIITHGLPRPRNLTVALEAEQQVREAGAVPATIGVINGEPVVGLSAEELVMLADGDNVVKISVRDLPVAAALGLSGGTTVAATAMLAWLAGVEVFSTGGIGGVHRGAADTFDESADLLALAKYPIVVVSAGIKSLLDIPATLERLETMSIPVVGYKTRAFPGFFVTDSGCQIDYAVETPYQVADMADARDALGLSSAILVANPVPKAEELDKQLHDQTLAAAIAAAEAAGIHGHDTTPFLLDYMRRETAGRSVETNLSIYRNNIALGAEIALAIAKLQGGPGFGAPVSVGSAAAASQGCGCGGGGCGGSGGDSGGSYNELREREQCACGGGKTHGQGGCRCGRYGDQ